MENSQDSEYGDSASSSASGFLSVPKLTGDDMYHVFISFSGEDSQWVAQLMQKLEATFPDIKICFHNRDFTPGKTIIENMTECIQRSQKILMVLSPDFVHSRWCLFEANLSMFQDCTSHKAIVPVMLKPCPMPLYLSHLTYLEAEDEQFFEKMCNRLLKTNAKETEDVLVHFQSSILYGGKHLLSLSAVNENDVKVGIGVFSDTCVPDALKAVVKDPEIYKKAIRLINDTPPCVNIIKPYWAKVFIIIFLISFIFFLMLSYNTMIPPTYLNFLHLPTYMIPLGVVFYKLNNSEHRRFKTMAQNMSRKTGEANLLLVETSILAGCASMSSLVFVFVSLKQCKHMFHIAFGSHTELEKCMWKKSIIRYSSDYANCLAKKHFPCGDPQTPGHLANGICFCQYVATQIEQGDWP
ncbi:uncharacterized protein LOC130294263 isoform X1 [Hyla sarda]|uniref:uncharacterized protein LOC130294263 isoform X1 n=1 Tax=Hyla sarda TaxID=327740 RepID=UPI0024C276EA|nr:uncharacterized protein LOC130294263 isoform X1 [Hyla sarda]XP_056399844.1 uncharacterized protein LOC130294263 isoform X1 [Hyla sarda]XP_056399845.1 uncharacterized protein LOC130294263 isoform X1 [Hyla sarda]